MHWLTIIADDLTGAADAAARCVQAGLRAAILLDATTPQTGESPVLALSTDSRHLTAAAAARRVEAAIGAASAVTAKPTASGHWYKKIDSTLRGNLGAEIDAALTLLTPPGRRPCALIAPAFPAQGRGLEQGFLVHGDTPPGAVHLPTRLRDQSARPQALIPLAAVRAGLDPLCAAIRTARGHGAELLAADAMTEPDLARLLAAMRQVAPTALLCGSAGLVGALARQLAATQPTTDEPAPDADVLLPCRRLLFVVGSGSAMARQQMDALIATGRVAAQVVNGPATASVPVAAGHALLCLPRPEPHVALDGPAARRLATQLARVALSVLAAHPVDGGAVDGSAPVDGIMPVDGIVLVGGDTAMHVLSDLGVSHLTVHRELLPGMPLASAHRPDGSRLTVVLKAGNHGDPGTLVALEAMLSSSGNER